MCQLLRWKLLTILTLLAAAASLSAGPKDGPPDLRSVTVADGIEVHYVERGKGVAVVFVHGTLGDYSTWESQVGPFAQSYRAVSYSRRYNYPNTNKPRPGHSAVVEADDLAVLLQKLDCGKAHIIGHSYGAYTALFLAVKHPELVRSLTLAEPPVVFAGERVDPAKEQVVKQAREAFAKGDTQGALRAIVDASRAGTYDKIPPPFRKGLLRNARELQALVTSDDMYPALDRDAVRKIAVPTLLLSGANSPRSSKLIDEELERLLPEKGRQRVIIRDANHNMWFQQPEACRKAVLEFLRGK
jgi:pimeloyl-ACP methyl ester carboxylesterase